MSAIIDRILTQLGDEALIEKLLALPKSDLNSLLLKVYEQQASKAAPADVLKVFEANRFSAPSEIDPAAYHALEVETLALAQKRAIKAVLLSPAAPLGGCSAFGCVHQNNIVSAARGVEVLSDPTNMLALIIAEQLKGKQVDNQSPLHYCTTARVLRAQPFPPLKGYYAHFGLFCIVSSCKDGGSYTAEKEMMVEHLAYYKELLGNKYRANLNVVLRRRGGYADGDGFFHRMENLMKDALLGVPIATDPQQDDNNYYKGINFKMYMESQGEQTEIGDGGYVDWIARMTGSKKERCLISCISLDRLLI